MPSTDKQQVLGVLGGGQLGRMLMEAANRLNIQVNILDAEKAPAKQISAHDGHITGSFVDREAIEKLSKTCDVITVEIEHVDTHVLEDVSSRVRVEPSWKTLRIIQDKFAQKEHLKAADVPLADYAELVQGTPDELAQVARKLGYPLMLKSKTQAYDGRGNYPVKSASEIPAALKALSNRPLYAEKWASFRMELAVMVVKTKDGVLSYPTVETVHEDSICKLTYAPARDVSKAINEAAQALARKAVAAFDGRGVFGVEMFLLPDDTLLLNEIAPRPHNSGHYTIEACALSQYDAHLRAVLGLPIPAASLRIREPSIMLNILGGAASDSHQTVADAALSIPGASIHLYGKGASRPGRKMGHVTLTARSMADAETAMTPLITLVDALRAARTDISAAPSPAPPQPAAKHPPTVAVIMGSDSDLPVLVPGLQLLDAFAIPYEARVTSAHRTPHWMASYVSGAAARGTKVIIAAAGGAAHLPGMAAAETLLPVIGVPVKGSVLDGVDSLYSIVQMPRGVPCLTVGVNNSVNAALGAARILAVEDERVRACLEDWVAKAEKEVLDKDRRLASEGWEVYLRK